MPVTVQISSVIMLEWHQLLWLIASVWPHLTLYRLYKNKHIFLQASLALFTQQGFQHSDYSDPCSNYRTQSSGLIKGDKVWIIITENLDSLSGGRKEKIYVKILRLSKKWHTSHVSCNVSQHHKIKKRGEKRKNLHYQQQPGGLTSDRKSDCRKQYILCNLKE